MLVMPWKDPHHSSHPLFPPAKFPEGKLHWRLCFVPFLPCVAQNLLLWTPTTQYPAYGRNSPAAQGAPRPLLHPASWGAAGSWCHTALPAGLPGYPGEVAEATILVPGCWQPSAVVLNLLSSQHHTLDSQVALPGDRPRVQPCLAPSVSVHSLQSHSSCSRQAGDRLWDSSKLRKQFRRRGEGELPKKEKLKQNKTKPHQSLVPELLCFCESVACIKVVTRGKRMAVQKRRLLSHLGCPQKALYRPKASARHESKPCPIHPPHSEKLQPTFKRVLSKKRNFFSVQSFVSCLNECVKNHKQTGFALHIAIKRPTYHRPTSWESFSFLQFHLKSGPVSDKHPLDHYSSCHSLSFVTLDNVFLVLMTRKISVHLRCYEAYLSA